ncbi:type ISP restriction/modification enzyme [Actinoplanes sp. GCM10030250]|uniref:type ISP restriction/modification enzyme n=1 Tax=Actinoplanes sp. GCM10030250 TaxID=3273376 RepID=UPI00361E038A
MREPNEPARTTMRGNRPDLTELVRVFGSAIQAKAATQAGEPEERLRAPFERLIEDYGRNLGLDVVASGETLLRELGIKPDYEIYVAGAPIGYVELKRPGKGVPTTRPPKGQSGRQWQGLQLLPNVLYTDGQQWALYRSGRLVGRIAHLTPGVEHAGSRLRPVDGELERLLQEFLRWKPQRPRTIRQLTIAVAALCRLLRDEVADIIKGEQEGSVRPSHFTRLAFEWRNLLFPNESNDEFANDYAQTVTFALLLARAESIDFQGRSVGEIAHILGKSHSLMGRALAVLVNDTVERDSIVIETMLRVIGVVDWGQFDRRTYLNLFEHFLQEYDAEQRKRTGSYYTPDALVTFVVKFVDSILRERLKRIRGYAADDVIVVDPAMGTGSFLAQIVEQAARTVQVTEGLGQIAPRLRSLSRRLIGFEKQVAPYAISQLRLHSLLKIGYGAEPPREEFRFLTDALDNPDVQELEFGYVYDEISAARKGANRVKRDVPVMVVISNPPYLRNVRGSAPWIEARGSDRVGRPNLDAFRSPGQGKRESVLANTSAYFWRWATWKVFDAHPGHPYGIVAFVSNASFVTADGYAGMREYLRKTASEGWIIDLSPELFRPASNMRIFPKNGNRVCVAIFMRSGQPDDKTPATIWHTSVRGTRREKLESLAGISLTDTRWEKCQSGWAAPLTPAPDDLWSPLPELTDVLPIQRPGVKPNRTWLYAPTPEVLHRRWLRLINAPTEDKAGLFKETDKLKIASRPVALPGYEKARKSIQDENGPCPEPVRVAFRAFDRQWTIPDGRLHHRPSPDLWHIKSDDQVFMFEQHTYPYTEGPGVVFSADVPDVDSLMGSHAGRVMPLFRDAKSTQPNVAPNLVAYLNDLLQVDIEPRDIFAYIAAVVAHRGFVREIRKSSRGGGMRLPITRTRELWLRAVEMGREVIWLHTYGERFFYEAGKQPGIPPSLPDQVAPKVITEIVGKLNAIPEEMSFDPQSETLRVGNGLIRPVSEEVWNYRIGTRRVVERWFDYRKAQSAYKWATPLNDTSLLEWNDVVAGEMLDLLNLIALCIKLEARQANLLSQVITSPLVLSADLENVGVLPLPEWARKVTRISDHSDLV